MATNSVLLNIVGGDTSNATQFTAQSPSFNRYFTIPNGIIKFFGDFAGTVNPTTGLTPAGFIYIEYHENNQWKTQTFLTSQNGAAIATALG